MRAILRIVSILFLCNAGGIFNATAADNCEQLAAQDTFATSDVFSLIPQFKSMQVEPKGEFEKTREYNLRLGSSHWRARQIGYVIDGSGSYYVGKYDADTETYSMDADQIIGALDHIEINSREYFAHRTGQVRDASKTLTNNFGRVTKRTISQYGSILYVSAGTGSNAITFPISLREAKDVVGRLQYVIASVPAQPFEAEDLVGFSSPIVGAGGFRPRFMMDIAGIVVRPVCALVRDPVEKKVYAVVTFSQ